ncbi:MAG: tRNA pseudouridine55 synthase [Algoriphagus sp.]|jgi:tRNA pseudouridine55 synthase
MDYFNENGAFLLIDKPLNWTSFDVVKKIRSSGKFKKVGHAGTLDPLASGLLILCMGKMTKQINKYQAQEKEYIGSFTLGKTTPSYDLETEFDSEYPTEHITLELIQEAVAKLTGFIEQIPPIFSAVKVNGRRAYDAARKGEKIKLKIRTVEVKTFEIEPSKFPIIEFRIVCSKGTYIRSMANDFGKLLQSGAHLSSLRRTKIGNFDVSDAEDVLMAAEKINKARESI